MYLQLGWRNIWRNRRRTMVIMTAVIIGVWSMIFLGALMRGIADQMVRNGISTLTGHIQVHQRGYRNDPVIENSIPEPEVVETALNKLLPANALWSSRVRVYAIASNARHCNAWNEDIDHVIGVLFVQRIVQMIFLVQIAQDGRVQFLLMRKRATWNLVHEHGGINDRHSGVI